MKRGVGVKSDGNGGYDINIQRAILKKYGLPALLVFLVMTGLGSRLGGELWEMIIERRAVAEKLAVHDKDIAEGKGRDASLAKQIEDVRVEVRQDLREIKQTVRAIQSAVNKEG